ncbi:MAG: glycosyltransferase family 87 protein [Ardenticatenaceae bacterium]
MIAKNREERFRSVLLLVVLVVVLAPLIRYWFAASGWTDFLAFYNAGRMVAEEQAAFLYEQAVLSRRGAPHFLYAPLYAAFFLPLGLLSFEAARALWGILGMGALALSVVISRRWSLIPLHVGLLVVALFFPTYVALLLGQTSPLTLLLFAAVAALVWRRGGGGVAGVAAGLTLFKPQLILPLLLVWLWRRERRALVGMALAAMFLLLGSLLVSPSATLSFPSAHDEIGDVVMGAVVQRQINPTLYTVAGPAIALAGMAAALAALLYTWRWSLRYYEGLHHLPGQALTGSREPVSSPYHHALLWLAPFVITPYLGTYDLLLLLLPLSFLAPALRYDRLLRLAVALLWLNLTLFLLPAARSLAPWSLLLLFALCAWRANSAAPRPIARHSPA